MITPLDPWFPDPAARRRFRRRALGRRPAVLPARDERWRGLAPGFAACVRLLRAGLPFQVVADRRYDRSGNPRRLRPALRAGATVYVPQVHQVLPRVMRLMVALRAGLLGPRREECSFLFLVEGRGRPGMGLHHDGPVDAFWVQLEGRRTVTIGPAASPRTPQDLDDGAPRRGGAGWRTLDLEPGSLLYLPPYTPHAVVCHGRSLALTMTWSRRASRGSAAGRARALARWDVASGRVLQRLRPDGRWLWTQVPVVPLRRAGRFLHVRLPGGAARVPRLAPGLAALLPLMPALPRRATRARDTAVAALLARGLLAPEDLPQAITPEDPKRLDGWRFA